MFHNYVCHVTSCPLAPAATPSMLWWKTVPWTIKENKQPSPNSPKSVISNDLPYKNFTNNVHEKKWLKPLGVSIFWHYNMTMSSTNVLGRICSYRRVEDTWESQVAAWTHLPNNRVPNLKRFNLHSSILLFYKIDKHPVSTILQIFHLDLFQGWSCYAASHILSLTICKFWCSVGPIIKCFLTQR